MTRVITEARRRSTRISMRAARIHWDWRGIAHHFGFSCHNTGRDIESCLGGEQLEFHHTYPETPGALAMNGVWGQAFLLLCKPCHRESHGGMFPVERGNSSLLVEDIEYEMARDGGYNAWLGKRKTGRGLLNG